jgi:hypothetical protein
LLILGQKPLIQRDVVVLMQFGCDDLLFESVRPCGPLDVATEMPEAVEFDDHVFEMLPFGDEDVADEVVEIVL